MAAPVLSRPPPPSTSYSFPRLETSTSSRSRTSSLRTQHPSLALSTEQTASQDDSAVSNEDAVGKHGDANAAERTSGDNHEVESPRDLLSSVEDLPIELISLIDRFIESLGAKVYNTPPSTEKLSAIFQDFYVTASSHINTHINALSAQQSRASSPHTSVSSKTSSAVFMARSLSRDILAPGGGPPPEQQMLTAQEISSRRRARRLLDRKGLALEEAVERRVCERVYNRIWRHRSTLDEMRDEKLRSRTAALAVVGIDLQELGVKIEKEASQGQSVSTIDDWISRAREGLLRMNDARYPLGKLQLLAESHKIIVDMLTDLHNSSSSADEILPTLIYTLISSPPEGINVVSNLEFIQRFRSCSKIDGEAAYCLTNLEAAVAFLETVDLASLRDNERLQSSTPARTVESNRESSTSALGTVDPQTVQALNLDDDDSGTTEPVKAPVVTEAPAKSALISAPSHRRRVSDIFQPPVAAFGAAGDAVRNTADQGIKGIGNALDNSFKLLFGRLGEQKLASPDPDQTEFIAVPKTLDDARKLVEPKPADSESLLTETSSIDEGRAGQNRPGAKSDDSLLSAIAGKKSLQRDRSDSNQSTRSSQPDLLPTSNGAIETVKTFSNNFNPLKSFGCMSVMRGFARTPSSGSTPTTAPNASAQDTRLAQRPHSPTRVIAGTIKTLPPIQRFMDATNAGDLKISEVAELLDDYKRLAEALKTLGAI